MSILTRLAPERTLRFTGKVWLQNVRARKEVHGRDQMAAEAVVLEWSITISLAMLFP